MNSVTFTDSAGVVHTVYLVPLQAFAQQFSISLGGTIYIFKLQWCAPAACWILQIMNSQGVSIVSGIPLITGADLLEQLQYLDIGGSLVVQSSPVLDQVPNYDSLGSTGNLFFLVPPISS